MKQQYRRKPDRPISVWTLLMILIPAGFMIWFVVYGYNLFIDTKTFELVSPYITPERTRLMLIISFLGNHSFLIPANLLLLAYFLYIRNKEAALMVAIASLTSVLVMSLLKRSFQRLRPSGPLVDGITNFSFPSGHAFMAVAFYGLLIWWVDVTVYNKYLRRSLIAFFVLLILLIGLSRIYLRVHYATDVLAGFFFGTAWLLISFFIADKIYGPKNNSPFRDSIGTKV